MDNIKKKAKYDDVSICSFWLMKTLIDVRLSKNVKKWTILTSVHSYKSSII